LGNWAAQISVTARFFACLDSAGDFGSILLVGKPVEGKSQKAQLGNPHSMRAGGEAL